MYMYIYIYICIYIYAFAHPVKGSTGVHHLRACPYFSSSVPHIYIYIVFFPFHFQRLVTLPSPESSIYPPIIYAYIIL